MDVRKIGVLNKDGTKYITLPKDWCSEGDFIKIEKLSDKELRLSKIE